MQRRLWAGLALLPLMPGSSLAKPVPALYPTKAAAELAAKTHFGCSGAHRMGDQWMPCAEHGGNQTSQEKGGGGGGGGGGGHAH
ncbi:MAG: DUF3721 domain-containing protein [Vulcanococcus sp.]|jgi:hypothetical protein